MLTTHVLALVAFYFALVSAGYAFASHAYAEAAHAWRTAPYGEASRLSRRADRIYGWVGRLDVVSLIGSAVSRGAS